MESNDHPDHGTDADERIWMYHYPRVDTIGSAVIGKKGIMPGWTKASTLISIPI
jgi:hypothetical protein